MLPEKEENPKLSLEEVTLNAESFMNLIKIHKFSGVHPCKRCQIYKTRTLIEVF